MTTNYFFKKKKFCQQNNPNRFVFEKNPTKIGIITKRISFESFQRVVKTTQQQKRQRKKEKKSKKKIANKKKNKKKQYLFGAFRRSFLFHSLAFAR